MGDGCIFEEGHQRQFDAEILIDAGNHFHGLHGVAADVKEVGTSVDCGHAKNFRPYLGNRLFRCGSGANEDCCDLRIRVAVCLCHLLHHRATAVAVCCTVWAKAL